MPYKRKYAPRRRYVRSSYNKTRKGATNFTNIVASPKSTTRKLRYAQQFSLDPGAAVSVNHFFSANSLFDPDTTGLGHQPGGFDQWATFFKHYRVKSSKITVTMLTGASPLTQNQTIATLRTSDTSGVNQSATNMIENGLCNWKCIASPNPNPTILTKSWNASKFFSTIKNSADLTADIGANPVQQAFFNVSAGPMDGVSNIGSLNCFAVIDYIVEFSGKRTLQDS